ncbi:MAG: hypothetical protein ABID04_02010, partial [Patescibacteria group bacterium]
NLVFDPVMVVKLEPTATSLPSPIPSSTPTPTKKPSPSPSPSLTPTDFDEEDLASDSASLSGQILGESDQEVSESTGSSQKSSWPAYLLPVFLVTAGLGLLGFVFVGPRLKDFSDTIENDEVDEE